MNSMYTTAAHTILIVKAHTNTMTHVKPQKHRRTNMIQGHPFYVILYNANSLSNGAYDPSTAPGCHQATPPSLLVTWRPSLGGLLLHQVRQLIHLRLDRFKLLRLVARLRGQRTAGPPPSPHSHPPHSQAPRCLLRPRLQLRFQPPRPPPRRRPVHCPRLARQEGARLLKLVLERAVRLRALDALAPGQRLLALEGPRVFVVAALVELAAAVGGRALDGAAGLRGRTGQR